MEKFREHYAKQAETRPLGSVSDAEISKENENTLPNGRVSAIEKKIFFITSMPFCTIPLIAKNTSLTHSLTVVNIRVSTSVPKPKLKADKENGVIYIDSQTTLSGVPAIAWEYKLGNRSALEWILD